MFIIQIDYLADLNEIDAALDAHRAWLDVHYAAGLFLASGRCEPRTGGIIIATDRPLDEIQAAVAGDPFAVRGLARHLITEFHASRIAPAEVWPAQ